MNKTVKGIAYELNINPLRIYRFISKNEIKSTKIENGTNFFDEAKQKKIEDHFINKSHYRNDNNDKVINRKVYIINKSF